MLVMKFLPLTDRQQIIAEAVVEAHAHTAARVDNNKVVAQTLHEGKKKYTTSQLYKHFKRGSKKAIKIGTAQLQYEDMVKRAERKLSEKMRASMASTQTKKEKATAIAKELFHRPGSMLTQQELVHMWQESGCEDERMAPNCTFPTVLQFRTLDGTCNNLQKPLFGASRTNFRRLIPGQYEDGVHSLRGDLQSRTNLPVTPFAPPNPSPRIVSIEVIENRTEEEMPFTHILMQWGQFLDHDLDLSPELEEECKSCIFTDICRPIRISSDDPAFGLGTQNNGDCLAFRRSLPSCPTDKPLSFSPREQLNDITSFIDGSMVYGSDDELAEILREKRGGLLRVGANIPANQPSLPVIDPKTAEFTACPDRTDCFLCGDFRCNEQISLSIMHTIWVREHNRCARELARINPQWDDERLYQECRLIVGALIQKITYADYLPKVFGVENYRKFVGDFRGYNPKVDPGVPNAFATAAYRYGHSLIRPVFDRLNENFRPISTLGPLNLREAFFNPPQFTASQGTDPIVRGLINTNALRMDEFMNMVLTTQLFQTEKSAGFDLASLNMQRGRDHGLPPYLVWRRFCEKIFGPVQSLFENTLTKVRFLNIYGSLDTVDLWIGGLAEQRLTDSLLGPTFACIFGLTFAAVRDGDAFFYERPGIFTPAQLRSIKQDSLSRVLCDNLDNLGRVQPDAFLSNQTRISCLNVPRTDLSLFREEPCFFRVGMAPRQLDTTVGTLFRPTGGLRFAFSSISFPPSTTTLFQCQEIQCPTPTRASTVVVYTSSAAASAKVTYNKLLTPNGLPDESGVYTGDWTRAQFVADAGLFTSRSACEGSLGTAMTFELSGRTSQTAAAASSDGMLPDKVLEIIKKGGGKQHDPVSNEQAGVAKEEKVKTVSDEALMKELEEALETLKS